MPEDYHTDRPEFKYSGHGLLEISVNKYIDQNKLALYTRYHDKRTEGAVILFFTISSLSLYKEIFLTKDELLLTWLF
jgi:hypothetical protein